MQQRNHTPDIPTRVGHPLQSGQPTRIGSAHLDFDRADPARGLDQEVDFLTVTGAPVGNVHLPGAMPVVPEQLAENLGFVDRTGHRGQSERLGVAPTGQPRRQAGIEEIEFRALDHPQRPVGVMRMNESDEKTVLQEADPLLGGVGRNSRIPGDFHRVQNLPRSQGAHPNEDLEFPALLDAQKFPHIPFDVGLKVAGQIQINGIRSGNALELGKRGRPDPLERLLRRRRRRPLLFVGESEEVQDSHPAGQRFLDAVHDLEALRSGQPDGPRRCRRSIGQLLDGTQQGGRILDFIDEERQSQIGGKQRRIAMCPTPGGQVVEIDNLTVGFGAAPKEGTLADLPRPEEQPDRKQPERLGGAPQNLFVGSPKPHVWQYFTRLHFCQDSSITPHGTLKESDPSGPRTDVESGAGFVP